MIPKPGDQNREVPVNETFHEQTDDELTEKELKQVKADDQAIQTILLGSDSRIQEKKAKLFNEWERFTSTDEESIQSCYHRFSKLMNDFKRNKHFPEKITSNLKQDRQIQMVRGNGGNQFRQYAGQNVRNQNRNQNGLIVVSGITNQDPNRNGNVVAARLRQASTSGTQTDKAPVYDSDGSAELENKIKELDNILVKMGQSIQTMHRLSPKPDSFYHTEQKMALGYQNPFYLKQAQRKQQSLYNGKVLLEKHDPPTVYDSEETLQLAQEEFLKEVAKFVREFKSLTKEADESLAKHKALELEIEHLLRAVVSQDIMSIVQSNSVIDTSNLQTELERTKERFENCIIKKENEYAKHWNDWINPFKPSREEKFVPNKVRASVRKNPITVLRPHVITKKGVNSNLNGLSFTGVDNTAKTRRLQPRSNTKNDRVPSESKSSCIKNKEVEVEEHPRNLLLSKNKKHISSKCNNVKLAIRNDKSEVVCSMYCFKHMTENLKVLINFIWKFLGTVRFGNDHVATILASSGKKCEKNYSSMRRYVVDLVNVFPKHLITKLIIKGAISDVNFEPSSRSKATEDIIGIGSIMEVLVLNHYVLVREISRKLSKLQDEDAQNKTNIQDLKSFGGGSFYRLNLDLSRLAIMLNRLERSIPKGSTSETDENTTNPPTNPPTPQAPHTLSTIKLYILKKGVPTENANQKFLSSTGSSSSTRNVAFISSDSTSSTNEVNIAYGVSTSSGHNSQREGSSSYTDKLMYSFFANQSNDLKLDHEDLEQIKEFDQEEMDLKWQVAMISMRFKKFYKKTGRKLHFDAKEPVGFYKNKVKCFNCHNIGHFARECRSKGNQESRRRDAGNTGHKARDNGRIPVKQDESKAMITIDGEGSDTKMSAKDKTGLGYGTQIHEGVLSYENEVFESVFDSRPSDVEDSHVNVRFAQVEGMHAVPPPMTGIYMPSKFDFRIDESKFTYGLKQSKSSESDAKTSDLASCESTSSVETLESVPKPVESKTKAVSEPKVWSDAPIIEEEKGIVDSGCSRHMTRNKAYLVEYQDFNGGHVAFGGSKGQITDTKCLVLSPDFKLPDKNQVLLRVPRQNNMYSFNLENIVPSGEFKNRDIIEFCTSKGIKREYSNAKTPQKNRVAERKNKTFIEAARTMLTDSFLPNTFWAEAVSTACYVFNRVLVTKPQNKTPYELLTENKANKTTGPKEANNSADTKDLLLQAGAARASSTNYVNTAITPVNTASTSVNTTSTPVKTASLSRNVHAAGPSNPNLLTYTNQDDSQIPSLEDIYEVLND
nr:putative ribonuclease H-like domain-containing protein [Tanacetum cinerariifolium]